MTIIHSKMEFSVVSLTSSSSSIITPWKPSI
ncbi:uncharacterized protein An01g04200 [Aspergillus niger]|uniref:Contig An01c0140, genomic contig n=2 Tax=Aspergillus niger TaxID=5061 RepID=A2Q8F9_ASPNC|nr:uncharacterized protein An01g04200 [Aspergillus niger]CAK36956.1 unnamed protein product [Aspergillus niger]